MELKSQSEQAIEAASVFNELEERLLRHIESLECADLRLLAIGRTQLQGAFMFLTRSILQPERLILPEDDKGMFDTARPPEKY